MVQAAAGALLGAFSGQSRRMDQLRPQITSSLPVLASSSPKMFKKLKKQADREQLYNLIMQPEVLGYLMAFGGLMLANNVPFSGNEIKNAALQGIASTLSVALGLGYAGVGDLTSLSIALAAGGASILPDILPDISIGGGISPDGDNTVADIGVTTTRNTLYNMIFGPIAPLLGLV